MYAFIQKLATADYLVHHRELLLFIKEHTKNSSKLNTPMARLQDCFTTHVPRCIKQKPITQLSEQ